MNSITSPQLAAMLVISDIFALVCYNGGLSAYTAVGLVSGIALQYVMVMPLVKAADKGKTLPKAVKLLLVSGLVLWGGALLGGLWKAADITFVPYENAGGFPGKLEITAMVAAVSLYIAYEGTKAAARSSLIAAFTGVIFLLTDLISGMRPSNFGNIPAAAQYGTFMDGLRLSFLGGGSLITFIALLPCVKGRKIKAASLYFLCRGILSAAVVMTAVLVTGGIMDTADFPVIMSAQLSQPFSSQRIDALFLILFAVFGVFALTVQVMTAAFLAGEIFSRFRRWRCTAAIALTLLAMGIFTGCTSTGQVSDKSYVRCVGTDGKTVTLSFFSDERIITAEGEDISSALAAAKIKAGRPVVTGFTELIILGNCNRKAVLEDMLKKWKVSPSCMVMYSGDPVSVINNTDPSLLEGRLKEAVRQGKAPVCDIITVLGNMQE